MARTHRTRHGTSLASGCRAGCTELTPKKPNTAHLDGVFTLKNSFTFKIRHFISINAPLSFTRHHIMPHLAELKRQYPRLQLKLTQSDSYIDPYKQGADLVFRIGSLADSSLHARILGKVTFGLFASPEYLDRVGKPRSLDELAGHDSVVFKEHLGVETWFAKQGDECRQVRAPIGFAVNDGDSLLSATISGMGVAMLINWLSDRAVNDGKLAPILTDYEWLARAEPIEIAMIYPHAQTPPRNVRAVMDFFIDKYQGFFE